MYLTLTSYEQKHQSHRGKGVRPYGHTVTLTEVSNDPVQVLVNH